MKNLNHLLATALGSGEFTRAEILELCLSQRFGLKGIPAGFLKDTEVCTRVGWGQYRIIPPQTNPSISPTSSPKETASMNSSSTDTSQTFSLESAAMLGATGGERETIIPPVLEEYVPWGHYNDLRQIIDSKIFAPVYITGMSGNGKTTMVEQICAKLKRECFRVNIVGETDEDDLLGGYRLFNGNTVWQDGPVVKAMRQGAVLLLDEIDLGTSKLMCLQPVLEGKGVYLKKTNNWVRPAIGFNIIATANTKGKGSDDGRFVGTNVMNEAMLDRFDYTYNQAYAPRSVENKIVKKAMKKFEIADDDNFSDKLTKWSELIRKLFDEGSIDEIISTRRLVNIIKAVSMFKDREKGIRMCLARFDEETSTAFFSAYCKVDDSLKVNVDQSQDKDKSE
jgi:MoxR-like ATPase